VLNQLAPDGHWHPVLGVLVLVTGHTAQVRPVTVPNRLTESLWRRAGALRAKGVRTLEIDTQFILEHPEIHGLDQEFATVLREQHGR
jgi:hypothetical protein